MNLAESGQDEMVAAMVMTMPTVRQVRVILLVINFDRYAGLASNVRYLIPMLPKHGIQ